MPISFDDLSGGGFGGQNPFLPARRSSVGPATLPVDEATLLGGLMESGLGGLAYVGKVIDKAFGGRAVRGALGGNYSELASVLPFSDTLGITDERNIVSGKTLGERAGFLTPGDDSLSSILGGVAVEVALDPAMWIGAGIPNAVLKAARGTSRGLGSAIGAATGFNPHAAGASAIGAVGDRVVPPLRALFDTSVHGSHLGPVQRNVAPVFDDALNTGRQAAEDGAADSLVRVRKYAQGGPQKEYELYRAMTLAGEGYGSEADAALTAAGYGLAERGDILRIANGSQGRVAGLPAAERGEGLLSKQLEDLPEWKIAENNAIAAANQANGTSNPPRWVAPSRYAPRTLAPYPGSDEAFGRMVNSRASGGSEFQLGRDDFLRGIPGGTVKLDDWARDPRFSGAARQFDHDQTAQHFLEEIMGGPAANVPLDHPAWLQARKLADFYEHLRPEARANGLFNLDLFGNVKAREFESARTIAGGRAAMRTVAPDAGFVRPVHEFEAQGQPFVRVPEFLDSAALKHPDPLTGQPASQQITAQLLGIDTVNDPHWMRRLAEYAIPKDVAVDVARMGQAWVTPETMRPILGVWDSVVNLFKSGLTAPFAAFHTRNLMSGVFNMWRDGVDPTVVAAVGPEVMNVIRGGRLSDDAARTLFPHLAPEQATEELVKELIANRIAFVRGGQTSERVGMTPAVQRGMLASEVPDVGNATLRPLGSDIGNWASTHGTQQGWWNPTAIAGVGGNEVDRFAPVALGRALGNTVEDWVRGTHYLGKRLSGATAGEAKLSTLKYQIDYGDMTNFEREVMKRFFPWYAFSRKNLPPLLEDLATKPALLSASIRGATGTRERGDFVPPWVAEGSSVRLPGGPDGSQRFISSFGLPFEDEAIKTIGAGLQMDPRRFFQQMFGQAQPFVKLPAEIATGTQMFSGRRLEDLEPYEFSSFGGLLPDNRARQLSQVLANSPLSRFFGSADKLLDERKPGWATTLNLGTGVRITDVDESKVKERAAADLLRNLLRGQPGVRSRDDVYVPRDQLPNLTERDLGLYDMLQDINSRQAARGRAAARAQAGQ